MAQRRVHVHVSGTVQGVYYRLTMQKVAASHDVVGWVRNLADGRVEATVEGDAEAVGRVLEWCARGPDAASVGSVEAEEGEPTGEFHSFDILD